MTDMSNTKEGTGRAGSTSEMALSSLGGVTHGREIFAISVARYGMQRDHALDVSGIKVPEGFTSFQYASSLLREPEVIALIRAAQHEWISTEMVHKSIVALARVLDDVNSPASSCVAAARVFLDAGMTPLTGPGSGNTDEIGSKVDLTPGEVNRALAQTREHMQALKDMLSGEPRDNRTTIDGALAQAVDL